jgi:hypothetical protein
MSSKFVFKPSKKFIFNPRPPVDKPINPYREQKLTIVQKNFHAYKPVRPFNRFGKPKIANTGIDPSTVFINFNNKDPTQPYNAKDSSIYNEDYRKYVPTEPLKWSVGNTYVCNDERLLPKKDQFKEYNFSKHIKEEEEKYKINYLSTDHISIRMPKDSKSVDNKSLPYLKMKSEFGPNENSDSYWVPKIQDKATMSNRSSVEYNIINNQDNPLTGVVNVGILDKAVNNKKKGVAEFSDYLKPFNYNPNKRYLKYYDKNNDRFHFYKGVFSELYDSTARNGNIYIPFKGDSQSKNK